MLINYKRLKLISKKDVTVKRVFSAILSRIIWIPYYILYYMPFGFYKNNRKKLAEYYGIHKNKRCFIIANGPSLKKIDFSLLKNEITIGMNRIYLMKDINGFVPTYLACIDRKSQILQFYEEFNRLNIPCFFEFDMNKYFDKKNNQYFIKGKFGSEFSTDIRRYLFGNGKSVTYTCMQLAYYMGFSEVYLIGKDHNYNTQEKAGVGIKSDGKEENHFIKGYYKPGQNWDAPDYKSEEYAYSLAKKAFDADGRIIKDATIGGKLDVFEKVEFHELFNDNKCCV